MFQALSKYSVRVSKEDNDLTLTAVSGAELHDFKLNEDNLLLVQKSKLEGLAPEGENEVSFKVKGKGCFMIQTVLRYNVLESPDKTSFTLTASQVIQQRFELFSFPTGKGFPTSIPKSKSHKVKSILIPDNPNIYSRRSLTLIKVAFYKLAQRFWPS